MPVEFNINQVSSHFQQPSGFLNLVLFRQWYRAWEVLRLLRYYRVPFFTIFAIFAGFPPNPRTILGAEQQFQFGER